MSPRAAWRLEAAGFTPVFDYVAGKTDWLAADLPYDGGARLVGAFTRRQVPVVPTGATVRVAQAAYERAGFGPVIVVNDAQVVMGVAHRDALRAASEDVPVGRAAAFGVSTVRPSEQVAELVARMQALEATRAVVTRSDGTLVGLFFTAEAPVHHHHHDHDH